MGFDTSGPHAGQGHLHPDRPDPPNRPPYTDRPEAARLGNLRTLGKYARANPHQRLELALHHVVPWNVLRDFWNALAAAGWYGHLRDVAALFGRPKAQTQYWPDDMANGRFDDRHGGDDFAQNLCWWPWNLVRGPKHRTTARTDRGVAGTDPGDDIDDLSRGHDRHVVHLRAMVQVGHEMEQVIRAVPTLEAIDDDALTRTIARWQVLAWHPLVEFDPAAWRIEVGSPDYAPGDQNRHATQPRWNKRTRADG